MTRYLHTYIARSFINDQIRTYLHSKELYKWSGMYSTYLHSKELYKWLGTYNRTYIHPFASEKFLCKYLNNDVVIYILLSWCFLKKVFLFWRAFVEFIRDQSEQMRPGVVSSAVYVAVKIRCVFREIYPISRRSDYIICIPAVTTFLFLVKTLKILYPEYFAQLCFSGILCVIFSQLLNYLIILADMYLFPILEFIVNHNCVYDSCDISACHQINEDSDSEIILLYA